MHERSVGSITGSASIPHWSDPDSRPMTVTHGEGSWVYDDEGERYLDFLAQLYCVNAGHGNARIIESIRTQLDRIQYVSAAKQNDCRSRLASRLVDKSPDNLTDVVFAVSGSEANELAIQLARSIQGTGTILTRWQSYHGSTYAAAALGGDPNTRATVERHAAATGHGKFLPPLAGTGAFDADSDAELAHKAADHLEFVVRNEGPDSVAAIVMEPVGGTSGAYPAPPGYFTRVREICDEYDILLIVDEVIAGFGRCGDWFGIQAEGVQPDMITFAKGVTSGYAPLGGVLLDAEIGAQLRSTGLRTGQTFGGHPISCAAGLGAMEVYEGGMIDHVRHLEPYFERRLIELHETHEPVSQVRGRGFLWSVVFADPVTGEPYVDPRVDRAEDNPVEHVRERASEAGVLFGGGRPDTQIILSPPFTAGEDEIDTAVDVLDDVIPDVFSRS